MRPKVFVGACVALCLIISTTGLLAAQRADGEDTRQLTRKVATRHDVSFDRNDLIAAMANPRIEGMAAVDKADARLNSARGLAALGQNEAAAKLLNDVVRMELPTTLEANKIITSAYVELGGLYTENLDKAVTFYGQAIDRMTLAHDGELMAQTIRSVATQYFQAGDTREAERLESIASNVEAGISPAGLGWLPRTTTEGQVSRDAGDDTCDAALPSGIPSSEIMCVAFSGDANWREIVVTETAQIRIETLSEDILGDDTTLTLENGCPASSAPFPVFNDDGGPGFLSLIEMVLEPGTYWVRVGGFNNTATPCDFELLISSAAIPEPDEYEPDNELTSANRIGFRNNGSGEGNQTGRDNRQIQTHNFFPEGDIDVVFFGLSQANLVRIETSDVDEPIDTIIGLSTGGGALLAVDDDGGDGFASKLEFCLGGGDWFVPMIPFSASDLFTYDITVDVDGHCLFESEPNGSCGQAGAVDFGEIWSGVQISGGIADNDYFSFTLAEEAYVVIATDGYDIFDVDTFLELYDGCPGNLLVADDDGGDGFLSRAEGLLPAGTYYFNVTVSPFSLGASYPYSVSIEVSEPPLTEIEPNDSCGEANPVALGDSVQASISPVGDKDWFRLTVTSDTVAEVETAGPSGDTVLEIRSGDGTEYIGCDDDGGVGLFSLWSCCLPPGDYCVGVKDWNNNSTIGTYTVDFRDLGSCTAGEPLVCPITDPFDQCDPF
jgi:hypothetical protein